MPEENTDTRATHQIELAIAQLESLSTLPCVAVQFSPKLLESQFSPASIADIIESDPALTTKILALSIKHNAGYAYERFSLRHALDRLPADEVRNAILSIKALPISGEDNSAQNRIMIRKELVLHSLAVACSAKEIAEITLPQVDPHLAYCAGLLHDLGKFALEEVMPKSFTRIFEQAQSEKQCSCTVERGHLGADHTIFGKRLAEKWRLPSQVILAIWLHHSDTGTISWNVPEARIAQLIQSADSVARQSGVGLSGSFDSPQPLAKIAQSLGISLEQLQQIHKKLPETIEEKSKILGLDLPDATTSYHDIVHTAATKFGHKESELSLENRRLQTFLSQLDFIVDFLQSFNSSTSAIDIAKNFVTRWQKYYQTGSVCLYLLPSYKQQSLEAVVVEGLGQSKTMMLNVPENSAPIPKTIINKFEILNADENIAWLMEQLGVDFDLRQTKLIPLLCSDKAVGAIVFEVHWPIDMKLLEEKLKTVTSIVGLALEFAVSRQKQEYFAESFARLVHAVARPSWPCFHGLEARATALDALAEMAAGIAHELNNPLSVISGRAQLLTESETDPKKKQSLKQIHQNTSDVSKIVEDLMSFAEPPQSRPAQTEVKQMLDEAIQLASQKSNVEKIDVQIEAAEDVETIFADSGQIVSAIANIICNSLESYLPTPDETGPIKITAVLEVGDMVKLEISDQGCGMDEQALRKATQPFFSARPAGRNRGMGLAFAARLIQLNEGTLQISSRLDGGTTVTVSLPCK